MDEAAIRARLDACLLDGATHAQGPFEWTRLDDPFPAWDPIEHREEPTSRADS